MRTIPLLFFLLWATLTYSQNSFDRGGFIFGAAAGVGRLSLSSDLTGEATITGLSFPNFKIGTMVSTHAAVVLMLPGTVYPFNWDGRSRDRGFEGIIPSFQFWPLDRWWILGGVGLGLESPAFYDIKDASERKFYFGPGVLAGTGYEIWRKASVAFDLQGRVHYGNISAPEGKREGFSINLMVGVNWY